MIPTVIFAALACILLTFYHNEHCAGDELLKKNQLLSELVEKQGLIIDKLEQIIEEYNNDDDSSNNTNK